MLGRGVTHKFELRCTSRNEGAGGRSTGHLIRRRDAFQSLKVLLQLGEVFPAVKCAERAVELDPTWAIGRQTLGRAQLGLGEVEMVSDWNETVAVV